MGAQSNRNRDRAWGCWQGEKAIVTALGAVAMGNLCGQQDGLVRSGAAPCPIVSHKSSRGASGATNARPNLPEMIRFEEQPYSTQVAAVHKRELAGTVEAGMLITRLNGKSLANRGYERIVGELQGNAEPVSLEFLAPDGRTVSHTELDWILHISLSPKPQSSPTPTTTLPALRHPLAADLSNQPTRADTGLIVQIGEHLKGIEAPMLVLWSSRRVKRRPPIEASVSVWPEVSDYRAEADNEARRLGGPSVPEAQSLQTQDSAYSYTSLASLLRDSECNEASFRSPNLGNKLNLVERL